MIKKLSKVESFKFNSKKQSVLVNNRLDENITSASYLTSFANSLELHSPPDDMFFFKPDFYWDDHKWVKVGNCTSGDFDLDSKCIVRCFKQTAGFNSVYLELSVDSESEFYENKPLDIVIEKTDYLELEKLCPTLFSGAFCCGLNIKCNKNERALIVDQGKLFFIDSVNLKGSVLFWYSTYSNDKLILEYCKDPEKQKTNYIRKKIRNLKNEYIKEWTANISYKKNDVVDYEGSRYIANECSSGNFFDHSKWNKIDILSSFFDKYHNQFKLDLSYQIEKKIGDQIRLVLMNLREDPKLNTRFKYGQKRYRVIEVTNKYYGGVKQTILKGLEFLNLDMGFNLNFPAGKPQECEWLFDKALLKLVLKAPFKYSVYREQKEALRKLEDVDATKI